MTYLSVFSHSVQLVVSKIGDLMIQGQNNNHALEVEVAVFVLQ